MMTREQQGVVLFLGLLLTFVLLFSSKSFLPPTSDPVATPIVLPGESSSNEAVWVEVDGPVRKRGIHLLEKGKSALEAIGRAGGMKESFSLSPEAAALKIEKSGLLKMVQEGGDKGQMVLHSLDPAKMKVLSIPININTAKAEELDILPGVGPKMAQAIIDFRKAHGKFSTLEDLQKVKGVGPKKFAAIRPHITLTD